jgi:hypothetical protein
VNALYQALLLGIAIGGFYAVTRSTLTDLKKALALKADIAAIVEVQRALEHKAEAAEVRSHYDAILRELDVIQRRIIELAQRPR